MVDVTAQAPLDPVGRVIHFAVLKERVGGWGNRNWDHGSIYHTQDVHTAEVLTAFARARRAGSAALLRENAHVPGAGATSDATRRAAAG
jgi:hypothetical protein